jgi:hypothetical protein
VKVVLSSLWYPMAFCRYFEAAINRRDDIELFTVGPYTGSFIPWGGGMNLPAKYAKSPSLALPVNGAQAVPITFIEKQLPWEPDVWLQIDAGFYLTGRPAKGKNIIVGTDPHVLNYNLQRGLADDFYCMQAEYAKTGDKYLPYAYDPIWHTQEPVEREYDACLLGLHYEQRDRWVKALQGIGLKVYYDLGPSFEEARTLYSKAPIGLNWSSLRDLTARVFELLGMGRLAVVNNVPDLPRFFKDGEDLITFDTLPEAIDKVAYYHSYPEKAQAIAKQGHKSVQEHTWDNRVQQILEGV